MTMISIVQLTCDEPSCTHEFTGEAYGHAIEAGWGYEDESERDLCPDHAIDPDDRGCCA